MNWHYAEDILLKDILFIYFYIYFIYEGLVFNLLYN